MLGKFIAQVHEDVSFFLASRRWSQKCRLWLSRVVLSASAAPACSARSQSVVVGASRRSAAPGSQLWALPGTAALLSRFFGKPLRLAPGVPGLIVLPVLRLATGAMPNPSIERTCPGKPGHASHVKR